MVKVKIARFDGVDHFVYRQEDVVDCLTRLFQRAQVGGSSWMVCA